MKSLAGELVGILRQQLMEEVRAEVMSQTRAQVINELRGMSLAEIMGLTEGAARDVGSVVAPAKRGPGRPKKAAGTASSGDTKKKKSGTARLRRRGAEDIASALTAIKGLLGKRPAGLRSEQIGKELGLDKRELPRPLAKGLAEGSLRKKGQKRSTTYFVTGGVGSEPKKGKKRS